MTYSMDFRRKVLSLKERDQLSFEAVAERFEVGKASVFRWSKNVEARRTRQKPATQIDMEKLKPEQDLLPQLLPQSIIIMDNATFHKRTDIRQLIEGAGSILEYLPAYSPDLNPIERKWAQAKAIRQPKNCSVEELFTHYVL